MKRIGIYGGTFDPVHHAHLILARDALEKFDLEKMVFVPAAVSPFKDSPAASNEARWRMLAAAIANEPRFEADACELRRPPPSYTIETIEQLREKHRGTELFLLLGDDNLSDLPRWHRFSELKKMVRFVVLPRLTVAPAHDHEKVDRRVDISATEVRARVAAGRSIRYLVPQAVEEFIRAEKLYREVAQ